MSTAPDQVEATVDAALDLPVAERAAYLDQVCGDNLPLRQLVEALLHAHGHAPAPGNPRQSTRESTAAMPLPLSEKPGDMIGPYKLLQEIGEGGCGVVYMAEQEVPVRRRVALKVIKLGMDTKQVIARFEAERQALALMDHPNIAKVLEAGASETGRPFFVMELVRGIRITDYCDQNDLPTEARLELFIQVCKAVQHAHQKGVIHRDLKPSNILVTLHDGVPVPKVIDFGIAKATQQRLTDKTLFTALEQFIGTPAYMSPEQAEMSGLDIDTRSDIYSLGVLLYELLTGQMPFNPKSLMVAGLDEMRRIIREQDPVRPSTRLSSLDAADQTTVARRRQVAVPKLLHLVRGDLDWIVMKCLEKDRTRRYETANGLARDIERHLNNEPVVASPPGKLYRFQKLVRRNKGTFTAVSAVAAALIFGLALSTCLFLDERAARQRATTAEQKAGTEAHKSRQVTRLLQDMLKGVGPSKARGRDTAMLKEILDETSERVSKELNGQPEVEAELRATIGEIRMALGDYAQAEGMFRAALQLRRMLQSGEQPEVASLLSSLSSALLGEGAGEGKLDEAEQAARDAVAMQRKLLSRNDPALADSLNNLANVLWLRARLTEAVERQREAVDIARRSPGAENPRLAKLLDNLGTMLRDQDKLPEAEAAHREALTILRKTHGADDLDVANALLNLGNVLRYEGNLTNAEQTLREALGLRRTLLPREHPDVAVVLNDLANVLQHENKLAEAETNLTEALAIHRKTLGPTNLHVATDLDNLAIVFSSQRKYAQAESNHLAAVQIYRQVLGEDAPDLAIGLKNLAFALKQQGKLPEAEKASRECLAIWEKRQPNQWQTFSARCRLGGVLLAENKFDQAEPLLLAGYEGLERQAATSRAQAKISLKVAGKDIVRLYEAWGKPEQAEKWREKLGLPGPEQTTPK